MAINDKELAHLHPDLEPKCREFMRQCTAANLKILITETWRDPKREDQLHAQGITRATGQNCKHCFTISGKPASKAFDFIILDDNNRIVVDGTDSRYTLAGEIAKKLGLIWGGNFSHPDYDHIEIA